MARTSIKMINAALDDVEGDIILRGVVDPASLAHLLVADYQREQLPASTIRELAKALQKGGVPDIVLGMRGGSFIEREGAFYLQDDVFIIDGLQRRTAALTLLDGGSAPRLGATVAFNTNEASERELFRKLNTSRVRLSPNVLMRNARHDNQAADLLFNICKDSTFALHDRVSWAQSMRREHLLTALVLLKTTSRLHARFSPGLLATNQGEMLQIMERLVLKIGRSAVRNNVKTFWEVLDHAFNVRNTTFKGTAPYLRQAFLVSLAKIFAKHEDFWSDTKFVVSPSLRKKIALFPLTDPYVANLCSATGAAANILYTVLVDHINSGKRTGRLTPTVADREDEPDMLGIHEEVVDATLNLV